MRGALAAGLLAALSTLAACSVQTEGAPCQSTANCPDGQGCGADGRCSAKALACAACRPGETRCGAQGLEACEAAADGVCAAFAVRGCASSQACQLLSGQAACVCKSQPAECTAAGDGCVGGDQVASCQADGAGCLTLVAQVACQAHQACSGDAPTPACACIEAPACTQVGAFCDGGKAVTCGEENGCRFLVSGATCGAHQACAVSGGTASCACLASACSGAGAQCSEDRRKVLACARDADLCFFESGAVATCDPGFLCGDAVQCVPTYQVAITGPAPDTLVGPNGVQVTATVTLATADAVAAPAPPTVTLIAPGFPDVILSRTGANGLVVTYARTWTPPSPSDGAAVVLTARVVDAALRAYDSAPLALQVDTLAPRISSPSVTCSTNPCVRDAVLTISATVADTHLTAVSATLDLDGARTVTLGNGGAGDVYSAQLALKDWPFPVFRRSVVATVHAGDSAGNTATSTLPPATVTRLRWATTVTGSPQLTGPAVDAAGTVVVAGNDRSLHRLAPDNGTATDVSLAARANPGAGPTQPPVIGAGATWIATDDGVLFALLGDGTFSATCPAAATNQQLYRPVLGAGSPDGLDAGGANNRIYDLRGGICLPNNIVDPVTAPLSGAPGVLFAPISGARASLNRYLTQSDGTLTLAPSPPPSLQDAPAPPNLPNQCSLLSTAPAVDGLGRVFAACDNRQVHLVDFAARSATWLGTFPGKALESAVVMPGNDIVVGTDDDRLRRLAPASSPSLVWSTLLDAPPTGVAVVSPDPSGVALLATTRSGTLHALTGAGDVRWSATGSDALGTAALRFPAVAPPPSGAPPGALPTLYASSAGGVVYAVVVDTPLDTTSPWPKAHHDLRNTGNAAAPLP